MRELESWDQIPYEKPHNITAWLSSCLSDQLNTSYTGVCQEWWNPAVVIFTPDGSKVTFSHRCSHIVVLEPNWLSLKKVNFSEFILKSHLWSITLNISVMTTSSTTMRRCTVGWTIRTKVQSSVYCFLPQLIPRLDNSKNFFGIFRLR